MIGSSQIPGRLIHFLALTAWVVACCGCEGKPRETASTSDDRSRTSTRVQGTNSEEDTPSVPSDRAPDAVSETMPVVGESRYVSFASVGVKLLRLEGFEEADNFHGFQNLESQSSVMAILIPGPFSESTQGFTADQLKTRGITLRGKEELEIEGLPAVLLDVTQEAYGIEFAKWILAFGDESETRLVTAMFPVSLEAELSIPLRLVVLNATLDDSPPPAPESEVGFTIVAASKLKLTRGISKMLMYTKDGIIPAKSPDDPLFLAAPSVSRVPIDDKRQFAVRRLFQTADTKITTITTNHEVTIDGLSGFEIVADAENADRGTPLTVYQVMLYDDGSYILMQGLVTKNDVSEYLPTFKAMAHSLKRRAR